MGRGWDACSTQAGRARTPPLRSRHVSEIGAATRHARHPKRLTRATRDTTLSGSRGSGARGVFLGFARARRAPDPRRVGGGRDRDHPESRKGRRKSSPLYAARRRVSYPSTTRIEGPRIPAQGVSNPPAMVLPLDGAPSPGLPPTSNATPPRAPPSPRATPPLPVKLYPGGLRLKSNYPGSGPIERRAPDPRARRSSASGSRREGRAPGTSPASAAHSQKKSSPGALAYRGRQRSVACRTCRTIEQWAAGGMPVLPKRGAHGRPPLRSRRVSEIGRRKRHDRHPKRLTRPTSGDTGHHFVVLEGGAAPRGASWV